MAKRCDPIKDKCPKGYVLQSRCTTTSNVKCLPCPPNHYLPYENSETSCWLCSTCNTASLQVKRPCGPEGNIICGCKDGMYCTYFSENSCKQCSSHKNCPRGEGVVSRGTPTKNTTCKKCPKGSFSNNNSKTEPCKPHSRCEAGVWQAGTSKADVICASSNTTEVPKNVTQDAGDNAVICREGSFCVEGSAVHGSCLRCQEYSVCGPGSEVSSHGTESSDAQCRPCPSGTFSNTTSSVKTCIPHTNCSSLGRDLLIQGTATTDATCAPFFSTTRRTDLIPTISDGALPGQPSNMPATPGTTFVPITGGAVPAQPPGVAAETIAIGGGVFVIIVVGILIYKFFKKRMHNEKNGIYIAMEMRPRIPMEQQQFGNVDDEGYAAVARWPVEEPLHVERNVALRSNDGRPPLPPLPSVAAEEPRVTSTYDTDRRDSGLGSGIINGGGVDVDTPSSCYNNLSGSSGRTASSSSPLDQKENNFLPMKQSSIENDVFAAPNGPLITVTINGPVFVERNLVESSLALRPHESPAEGNEAIMTTPLPEQSPHVPGKLVTASEYRPPPPPSPTSPVTQSGPLPLCENNLASTGGAQGGDLLRAGAGVGRNHPVESESPCEHEWTTCVV
ncbi:tumor necrosis factor receptor superfamily member 1B-like isoform X2 [Lethenteron reissneri]|uniref:tumor necrosis factor receptor superfamily member 1B-like isoform X2 n=1 Tax=Lethenteron reissneri TaxID=7753 RepID=UPI002AB760C3|nr:tumor necrosis factor receptor superfamily member 1B-like isoform X2 [Lethenteron reissneri]